MIAVQTSQGIRVTTHAVIQFLRRVEGQEVSEDYHPPVEEWKRVEGEILRRISRGIVLTPQQCMLFVKPGERKFSPSFVRALSQMADGMHQAHGAPSFLGTYFYDGDCCLVVSEDMVKTVIVPDEDQQTHLEEFMHHGRIGQLPPPAPLEIVLVDITPNKAFPAASRVTPSPEILRECIERIPMSSAHSVQILLDSSLRSLIDPLRDLFYQRPLRFLTPSIGLEPRHFIETPPYHELQKTLREAPLAYAHTVVLARRDRDRALNVLTTVLDTATPLTEEERQLPAGMVFQIFPPSNDSPVPHKSYKI